MLRMTFELPEVSRNKTVQISLEEN